MQANANLCLDVENVSALDNARIQQYTCNLSTPQENQLWSLVATGQGTYRLVPAVSAKCLDVLNPQNGSGAPFQQYACNLTSNQSNQVFYVTAAATAGYYRIASAYSGNTQCLDVPFSSLTPGQDVQQWACGPSWQDNQDWQIVAATARVVPPTSHVRYFGWYGEANLYSTPSLADDHANIVVYTTGTLPLVASRPSHIRAKLALDELVVALPKNGDLIANTFGQNGKPTDGGVVNNICDYWAQRRGTVAAQMSRVAAFYLDEPILNLRANGWSDADAKAVVQRVADVVKGPGCPGYAADPAIPFAVVEGYGTANVQQPSGVDWVGFDCYGDLNACNYVNLWNTQKALLLPHQKLIMVAPARTDVTPLTPFETTCTLPQAINSVNLTAQINEAVRSHFYLTLALSEPKTVAVWAWHGPSRYFSYYDTQGNLLPECQRNGVIVGGFDMAPVKDHWRFLSRALGFGAP